MIGKLKGFMDEYGDDHVIIDVGGVGYQVYCSARTLTSLPPKGEAGTVWVETIVREDMIRLYGFASSLEREWFRILTSVQGVGSKVALALLSIMKPAELANAIALQDKALIARAPGVGPKLATRLIVELKDKAPLGMDIDPISARLAGEMSEKATPKPASDAVSALVNLGYSQPQAASAVAAALRLAGDAADTASLIRLGLKELMK